MSRYIDADEFESYVQDEWDRIREWLKDQPTTDVVEVVRCKDCIHRNTHKCPSRLNDAEFYCCQGERR